MKTLIGMFFAALLVACAMVPQPDGVSWWDHTFGDTSIHPEHWNHPSKRWFKAAEPMKVTSKRFVDELPQGCIDAGAKGGCSQRDLVAQTCKVWVKNDPDRAKVACNDDHESRGHCELGMNHPPQTVATCGPGMTYAQMKTTIGL